VFAQKKETIKMTQFINCITHNASEGNLLLGNEKTAMFDCGMQFCADTTIEKVKNALNGRKLDYIIATHTHYDHIGGLPMFRAAFPEVKLITCEVGATVLQKDTPRRVIRELSATAAKDYGIGNIPDYSDDAFVADIIVKEGDKIDLGGITVEVFETPGHTRDSLSFYVPELELLILSETTGVMFPDGSMYPSYLVGFESSRNAIEKCGKLPFKHLSLPHRGIVSESDANAYFAKAEDMVNKCYDFVVDMYNRGLSDNEMLELFYQEFGSETLLTYQPRAAFDANAYATIACAIRESNMNL